MILVNKKLYDEKRVNMKEDILFCIRANRTLYCSFNSGYHCRMQRKQGEHKSPYSIVRKRLQTNFQLFGG